MRFLYSAQSCGELYPKRSNEKNALPKRCPSSCSASSKRSCQPIVTLGPVGKNPLRIDSGISRSVAACTCAAKVLPKARIVKLPPGAKSARPSSTETRTRICSPGSGPMPYERYIANLVCVRVRIAFMKLLPAAVLFGIEICATALGTQKCKDSTGRGDRVRDDSLNIEFQRTVDAHVCPDTFLPVVFSQQLPDHQRRNSVGYCIINHEVCGEFRRLASAIAGLDAACQTSIASAVFTGPTIASICDLSSTTVGSANTSS